MSEGWRVESYGVVDSTQAVLRRKLAAGERVDRLVVRAGSQSAGRGRRGSPWASGTGGSYQSLAVADPQRALATGVTGACIALCLAEALNLAGVQAMVKWPNDLYYMDRKLSGILAEHVSGHLLLGIGVNVENEVPSGAIALRSWSVAAVESLVLSGVELALGLLASSGGALSDKLRRRFSQVDWLAGKRVTVGRIDVDQGATGYAGTGQAERGNGRARLVSGVAAGIDQDGCLLLETESAPTVAKVCSGTILAVS